MLRLRMAIATYRGAVEAFGPWDRIVEEFGQRLPVLLYHHVGPLRPGTYPELTISQEQFECQIAWLKDHGYSGITSADWLAWLRHGTPLPPKPILLTFDDVYEDLATHAFPALRQHGFSAAVFLVTSEIGGSNSWDKALGSGELRLLNAQQIREWSSLGIEFGAHGRTHSDLTRLSSTAVENEVRGSRDDLEELLGNPVSLFAYPFGVQNESIRSCAKRYFDLSFATQEGVNSLPVTQLVCGELWYARMSLYHALPHEFALGTCQSSGFGPDFVSELD